MERLSSDEPFKAAAHGILLGCAIPVIAYNVKERHWGNLFVYAAFLAFEVHNILLHARRVTITHPD